MHFLNIKKKLIKKLKNKTVFQLSNETKAGLVNRLVNKKNLTCYLDISFAEYPRLKLDIYKPKHKTGRLPVLMFVHGGSWNSGKKDDYLFMAESFCHAGFITVVVNYRLAPANKFPDFVLDTSDAIKWVQHHIHEYDGDVNHIVAVGHSAGAFNLISAVNDRNILEQTKLDITKIKAVVGISGPYAYDFRTDVTKYAFEKEAIPSKVMPIHHITDNPVPHLLLLAGNDGLVADFNTYELQQALQEKGGEVCIKRIKRTNHITIIAVCALKLRALGTTRKTILAYINSLKDR